MAVSDWSTTAASNSTVGAVDIAENCPPGNLNDASRAIMADIATYVTTALFSPGHSTATAGVKAKLDWARDDATFKLEDEGAIWPGISYFSHGLNKTFVAGDGAAGYPNATLFVMANANGTTGDVCSIIGDSVARVNNSAVFGMNFIARGTGKDGCKFVGAEIDVEPASGDTSIATSSGGLFINIFNKPLPGPAIQLGGVSGGTFANGLVCGGIAASGTCLTIQAGASANSLTDSGSGVYGTAAHIVSNTHRIRFSGTASAHAFIYNDASNNLRLVQGSAGTSFRNNTDTATVVTIFDNTGAGVGIVDVSSASGEYRLNGTKVVGARQTGWTASTGTPSRGAFAAVAAGTASGTYTQSELQGALNRIAALEARLIALEADARTHGLIN